MFVGSILYTSIIIMIKITLINIVLKKVYYYPVATFNFFSFDTRGVCYCRQKMYRDMIHSPFTNRLETFYSTTS